MTDSPGGVEPKQLRELHIELKAGKKEEARKVFQAAAEIDPRVLRRYGSLAVDLGVAR